MWSRLTCKNHCASTFLCIFAHPFTDVAWHPLKSGNARHRLVQRWPPAPFLRMNLSPGQAAHCRNCARRFDGPACRSARAFFSATCAHSNRNDCGRWKSVGAKHKVFPSQPVLCTSRAYCDIPALTHAFCRERCAKLAELMKQGREAHRRNRTGTAAQTHDAIMQAFGPANAAGTLYSLSLVGRKLHWMQQPLLACPSPQRRTSPVSPAQCVWHVC